MFPKRTGPFVTWSFAVGDGTPIQTFPDVAESCAVRESNSSTESTILFHALAERIEPEEVRSPVVSPEVSAAYQEEIPENTMKNVIAAKEDRFAVSKYADRSMDKKVI